MASPLNIELIFLILQFLGEEKFKETRHKFEKESGLYFNIKYFEDVIVNGDLEEAEDYLNGFTKPDENRFSMKMFFEIQKQKYFEALDKGERAKALDILENELKSFSAYGESIYEDLTMLMTMKNIREHEHLKKYTDAKSTRVLVFAEIKRLLELDPVFRQKLQFPNLPNSRLRTLVNQSLNWQHHLCQNHVERPEIMTLYRDHKCPTETIDHSQPQVPVSDLSLSLMPPQVAAGPSMNQRTTLAVASSSSLASQTPATRLFTAAFGNNSDSENVPKRPRQIASPKEPRINVPTIMSIGQSSMASSYFSNNLPKIVVKSLDASSSVTSMDFHPLKETLLLVGTNTGGISTWDVGTGKKLESIEFTLWNPDACSTTLQANLAINRIRWSPEGNVFGAAYSKHMVQLFTHEGAANFNNQIEIDAHVGSVNDLAFCRLPKNQLSIVTCGEDKTIKVWDAFNGAKLFTFEGHEAPVYSVYPHSQKNTPYILSTATDGSFKAWFFEPAGAKIDYDKTDRTHNVLAYNEDGKRVFSGGRREDGESFIIELDESEGYIVREYLGLGKKPAEIIQFHNIKNRFLVAGDDFAIKYWDMDNANMLMALKINGLPASPSVRFSKEGNLLAMSASHNKIKILSNVDGLCLFDSIDAPTPTSAVPSLAPLRHSLKEITEQSQLRVLRVTDSASLVRVVKLIYNNAGNEIIALTHNGIHKIWKWQSTLKATTDVQPALWHHPSGRVMANNTDPANLNEAVPCFALSKNDAFVLSASGANLSLYHTISLKVIASVFPPPPAATSVAFLPRDNNIAAVGMDDFSIQIYHIQPNMVKHTLEGHTNTVTGLAFSTLHNILVSSGSDNKICVWNVDGWERKRTAFLQFPPGRVPASRSQTKVQFNQDQTRVLVVHAKQIAIYTAPGLDCSKQWFPAEVDTTITDATYSCDGQSVYIALQSGGIRVLAASSLKLKCKINTAAYLVPENPSLSSSDIFATSIACNPKEPNQFVLGLTDGGICVLEPKDSGGEWGDEPLDENVLQLQLR